jgi:RND superfamily putative drug exporter
MPLLTRLRHHARRADVFVRLGNLVVQWPWYVIGCWIVLAATLPALFPSLTELSQKSPAGLLPADAPGSVSARQMNEAFHESSTGNLLLVVLTDDKGLGPADEDTYHALVDRLRRDTRDVVGLQDFLSTPPLREVLTSQDGKAWLLPVDLAGELGSPQSYAATTRVSAVVAEIVQDSSLNVSITGPAATLRDIGDAGVQDQRRVEIAMALLLFAILLIIYRNPVTMLLPLLTIGVSLVAAQGAVAGFGARGGLSVSPQTIALLIAMVAGAGTDYAVFLISRYHDYLRLGTDTDQAVKGALNSIGKVIAASAATVVITFLGIAFTRLAMVSSTGVALAIAVSICFLAAITFLPAVLVLAGRRGWIAPRRNLTSRSWRRSGIRIVRRPKTHLVASLIVLIALASCASLVRFNYDSRKTLPQSAESARGYAVIGRHFPVNSSIPEYVLVSSPADLRTPRSLSDLEQMAQRISQLPGIEAVRGITRPTGEPLEEARLSFQAGVIGSNLNDAATEITDRTGDLNLLADAAGLVANALAALNSQADQAIPAVRELVDALTYVRRTWDTFRGDPTREQTDDVTMLIALMRAAGQTIDTNLHGAGGDFGWLDPVLNGLNTSDTCDDTPSCTRMRSWLQRLVTARDNGALDKYADAGHRLRSTPQGQTLESAADNLRRALNDASGALQSAGLGEGTNVDEQLTAMRQNAAMLADASRQVAHGVQLLVDEVKKMGANLGEVSAFLLTMKTDASAPSMSGFYIPPQFLAGDDFKKAAEFFVSPDGHTVRYLVQTKLNPFSTEAMGQVNVILDTARGAQPNTTLSDASISMTGGSVTLRDIRDYYDHDIRFIILVTIVVVLLTLTILLRAIVAPLYLVASVVISYLSALGIGVIVFQFLLGQELYWGLPGLTFIILVAVGADYNLLLFSRLRDESSRSVRTGVIRTVGATGGVITAAGVIFAASMFGMLFASISTLVQTGFVIGVGILLDTFLVRTLTVPATAVLVGRASWWPSRWRRQPPAAGTPAGSENREGFQTPG